MPPIASLRTPMARSSNPSPLKSEWITSEFDSAAAGVLLIVGKNAKEGIIVAKRAATTARVRRLRRTKASMSSALIVFKITGKMRLSCTLLHFPVIKKISQLVPDHSGLEKTRNVRK